MLFSNEEQVVAAQGDTSQIPRPYVMHVGEEWVFYNVESGPTGSRSDSLYGYEIATGETKLLVEDTFFIGGDLPGGRCPLLVRHRWFYLWTAESD